MTRQPHTNDPDAILAALIAGIVSRKPTPDQVAKVKAELTSSVASLCGLAVQDPHPKNEFLTEGQLCALVQINPRTAQRWRLTEEGPPFVRAGTRRVLYRRSDVDAWLGARTFKHRAAEATKQPVAA